MNGKYSSSETGQVLQGDHYWSYKRRSSRTTSLDGEFSSSSSSPQITFGVNPMPVFLVQIMGAFLEIINPVQTILELPLQQ